MSEDVDLHIAFEHGLMAQAGVLLVSASPLSEEVFRRVLARIRRDADIAAHYARRYLESGAPVPRRSFFEVLEILLQERKTDEALGTSANHVIKAGMPWPRPKVLPVPGRGSFHAASVAPQGTAHDLAGALRLVTRGLHKFLQSRADPSTAVVVVHRGSAP